MLQWQRPTCGATPTKTKTVLSKNIKLPLRFEALRSGKEPERAEPVTYTLLDPDRRQDTNDIESIPSRNYEHATNLFYWLIETIDGTGF